MTALVWGTWDLVLPAQHARVAVRRLPHGRPALFRACGTCPTSSSPSDSSPNCAVVA